MRKTWRVALLFVLTAVLFLRVGSHLGPQGWLWASVLLLSLWILVVFFSDLRLPQVLRGQRLEGQDPWGLHQELQDLCHKARLPLPKVFLFPSSTPTALSFGRSWRSAYLFLTVALLENLDREEVRAVLALELAKIKRLDILPQSLATGLTSWDLWLQRAPQGETGPPKRGWKRFWLKLKREVKRILTLTQWPPLSHLIAKFCVGSQSYLLSDQLASELLGEPESIARVLWKLESYSLNDPLPTPPSLSHLFVVPPGEKTSSMSYIKPQPSVRHRIESLVGHYPV